MHSNISSLSYHHLELDNLISQIWKLNQKWDFWKKTKKSKEHMTSFSPANYVYEHTPAESNKGSKKEDFW